MENILTMSNKKYYVNRTGKNNSEDRDVYVDHEQDEYVFNQGELRAPTATNNRHHPTHDREHRNEANVPKDRTNGISHGQHNIYLYQIPKRNKCTVKKSMDGVYDIANREDLDSADGKGKPKGCSNATNKYCWLLITALVFLVNTGAVLFAVIFITTPVQLAGKFKIVNKLHKLFYYIL